MNENERALREQIFERVRAFYQYKYADGVPPRNKVKYGGRVFDEHELVNLVDAALDFWLTAGPNALNFEKRFAEYMGVTHAALVNSGSSANLVAISALTSPTLGDRRLTPGDEVITVAAGFPSTVAPILQNNLVPVYVDINIGNYNAIPEQVEKAVGPKTRAIFLAHTLGNPFDVERILHIARRHDLWIIEDNCDAVGSRYKGKPTGGFGHLATVSFYPAHHITMGEGGCVLTNDEQLARIVVSFRDWGRDCYCEPGEQNTCGKRFNQQFGTLPFGYDHKYVYSHLGYNLKITDLQAAIGLAQLDKLDGFIKKRKANFDKLYQSLLGFQDRIVLPVATENSDPAWFCFLITVRDDAGFNRNELTGFLEESGIETRTLFAGNILRQPAFIDTPCRKVGNLINTDLVMLNTFFVGLYPGITDEQIEYMAESFNTFFHRK
ncbi:lipopolysaccharide biosynthesis protein RfbH [candidate division KSB1 bacterium]|nr:lipopolysaccharide biosynthesis protein RfbH [candidate division KSB1 bacterium]